MKVPEPRLFLDTSAVFAAAFSSTGGARELLRLGELGVIALWVGPSVLAEADAVFSRKTPDLRPSLAVLLARAKVAVGPQPGEDHLAHAEAVISYRPDARILAEALAANADFLVTHDQAHFLENPRLSSLPCQVGTPGDALSWLRGRFHPTG